MQLLLDVEPIRDAYRAKQLARSFDLGGVDVLLASLVEYLERFAHRDREGLVEVMAQQIYQAVTGRVGYGFAHVVRAGSRVYTCLAASVDDRVVIGVQPSFPRTPFPDPGWRIGRWYADPERNTARVHAWAREVDRVSDSVAFAIQSRPVTLVDGPALLRGLIANPDDIAARSVYADWLSEHGDARGELIAVACELATIGLRDPRRAALRARERELLAITKSTMADLTLVEDHVIRRGLVDAISITVNRLLRHGDAILAAHPIRYLRVLVVDATAFAKLRDCDALRRISRIEISARPKPTGGKRAVVPSTLAATTVFADTTELRFVDMDVADDGWQPLLSALHAPCVRTLALEGCNLGAADLALLRAPSTFPALQHLSFGDLRAAGSAELVADIARRPGLCSLALASLDDSDAAIASVVTAIIEHAPALTALAITRSRTRALTFAALRTLVSTRTLDRLAIGGYAMPTDLVLGILRLPELANLRELAINLDVHTDEQRDLLTDALLATSGTTRIVWPGAGRLGAERLARVLARVDVVRARRDGSLDLVTPS